MTTKLPFTEVAEWFACMAEQDKEFQRKIRIKNGLQMLKILYTGVYWRNGDKLIIK